MFCKGDKQFVYICIFPFEAELYEKSGLRTVFVGHPMIENLAAKRLQLARDPNLVGLFPGSRAREVRQLMPILRDVMRELRNMAVAEGVPHPSLKMQAKALCTHGRMYEIEDFDNKKRTKAGMAELETDLADLKKLLEREGLDDKLK